MANINYDDFINHIQPDPANPTATIMLSGFIGRGPEGHLRIYPDPSLGTWYDVPQADVVHSTAIPDAKLGGSYLWVKSSAEIKPGSAAAAAPAGGAQGGAAPAGAAQAGVAAAAPGPTPATHCFVCPPRTLECGQLAAAAMWPTPATHCFVCWPKTSAPAGCHVAAQPIDTLQPTPATHCFVCDPPQAAALLPNADVTIATVCTLAGHCAPTPATRCFICPPITHNCTPPAVCQPTPATHCFICPPITHNCTPQCMPTPASHCFVCIPPTETAGCNAQLAAAAQPTPSAVTGVCCVAGQAAPAAMQPTPTAVTHCVVCPPHVTAHCTVPLVCTMQGPCLITPATVCGCPPPTITQPVVCWPTQPVICGILPPSFGCQQGGHPQAAAIQPTPATHCRVCNPPAAFAAQPAAMQPTPTATTHCFICPPHTLPPACGLTAPVLCTPQGMCPPPTPATICFVCPPVTHNCTPATVCTQPPACQQHTVHNSLCICPTPSAVHQCGPQAAAIQPTPATHCHVCNPPVAMQAVTAAPNCVAPTTFWCTMVGCQTVFQCAPGRTGVFNPFGG